MSTEGKRRPVFRVSQPEAPKVDTTPEWITETDIDTQVEGIESYIDEVVTDKNDLAYVTLGTPEGLPTNLLHADYIRHIILKYRKTVYLSYPRELLEQIRLLWRRLKNAHYILFQNVPFPEEMERWLQESRELGVSVERLHKKHGIDINENELWFLYWYRIYYAGKDYLNYYLDSKDTSAEVKKNFEIIDYIRNHVEQIPPSESIVIFEGIDGRGWGVRVSMQRRGHFWFVYREVDKAAHAIYRRLIAEETITNEGLLSTDAIRIALEREGNGIEKFLRQEVGYELYQPASL